MVTEAEPAPADSDWKLAQDNLLAEPSRWGTLSWISAKALIDSINHGLDLFSDGLVPQQWIARVPGPPQRIIERPDDTTFMIIGNTGEQDASQYVVCPSLSAAVVEHQPGFVMIASDVIYPAGDVDDYRDGVFRPYRSPTPTSPSPPRCSDCRATMTGTTGCPVSCTTSRIRNCCPRRRTPRRDSPRGRCWVGCPGSCGGAPDRRAARLSCCTPRSSPPGRTRSPARWPSPGRTTPCRPSTCCWSPSTPASTATSIASSGSG